MYIMTTSGMIMTSQNDPYDDPAKAPTAPARSFKHSLRLSDNQRI